MKTFESGNTTITRAPPVVMPLLYAISDWPSMGEAREKETYLVKVSVVDMTYVNSNWWGERHLGKMVSRFDTDQTLEEHEFQTLEEAVKFLAEWWATHPYQE